MRHRHKEHNAAVTSIDAVFKVREASVQAAGNYSCIPFNSVGSALSLNDSDDEGHEGHAIAHVSIEVHTPPRLIQALDKFTGTKIFASCWGKCTAISGSEVCKMTGLAFLPSFLPFK